MNTNRLISKLRYINPIFGTRYKGEVVSVFTYPIEEKYSKQISQRFGVNPALYKPLKGHDGIDWWLAVKTPLIIPTERMTITDLITQTNSYGRHIWGKDENGHRHIFGHLNSFLCQKGDVLERGRVFALSGGNLEDPYHGYSTGAHLHWEWRPTWASIANGYAGAEDQWPFIKGTVLPIPVPVPEPLYYMTVVADQLRVRKTASLSGLTIEYLHKGDIVPIYGDILDGRVWARISPYSDRFACMQENAVKYMEVKK